MNQIERKLVKGLKKTLSNKFERIEIHRRPGSSSRVKECLQSVLGYVPILQPADIDMILWRGSEVVAVEVKAFTPPNILSFYKGIGQALALHRFGFDYAALWLLFLDTKKHDLRRGSTAWEFVRDKLKLCLDFTYFQVQTVDNSFDSCEFYPMQYLGSQECYTLLNIADPDFNIRHKWRNPIRDQKEQIAIRKTLELWFSGTLTVERLKTALEQSGELTSQALPKSPVIFLPTSQTSSTAELQTYFPYDTDES